MALSEWVIESGVGATLNTTDKHSGNSSFQVIGSGTNGITRGNSQQARVTVWVLIGAVSGIAMCGHISYGALSIEPDVSGVWKNMRATFWYDSANDTRWGRVEKWTGSVWEQVGNDTNFGSNSPSANSIRLTHTDNNGCKFDDIEVYEEDV